MTVESVTVISDLNASYPAAGDVRSEGDDHIRNLKTGIKTTFPNISGAVTSSHTELNMLDGATGTVRTSATGPIAGEWTLIGAGTVSGTPSTIDFIHGTGGVVIDSTYDEYLLVLNNIRPTLTATLRLEVTADGGSSWVADNWTQQISTVASGTASASDATTTPYLTFTNINSTTTNNGTIHVLRGASRTAAFAFLGSANGMTQSYGTIGTASIDGLRLLLSTSTFANQGTVKLYARKP